MFIQFAKINQLRTVFARDQTFQAFIRNVGIKKFLWYMDLAKIAENEVVNMPEMIRNFLYEDMLAAEGTEMIPVARVLMKKNVNPFKYFLAFAFDPEHGAIILQMFIDIELGADIHVA